MADSKKTKGEGRKPDLFGRIPPFSLEAEQSVLGAILIDPKAFDKIAGVLGGEDFYLEKHRLIFDAMRDMYLHDKTIDPVNLIDTLVKMGAYKDEPTLTEDLKTMMDLVPTSANISDHARIVTDKSLLRRLIDICAETEEDAFNQVDDAKKLVGAAEEKIFELTRGEGAKELVPIRQVLVNVYSNLKQLSTDPESAAGTPTGFGPLDGVLVGLGKSDLVLVGARPGMGKTSFAMNIAVNVAKTTKKAVCVFSLEMSKEQLVSRLLSSEALVDSYNIRSGRLSDEDWTSIAHAAATLAECDIRIDDTASITVSGIRAKLHRVREEIGLVIIDYLQLMGTDRRFDNKVQEVGEISRSLKILAKDMNVPVLCCAQLSRGPESRTDKRPMLSDLRDSGAIEQDADVVLFLFRDEYYKEKEDASSGESRVSTAEVIIAKNRHGASGKVKLGWDPAYTRFRSIDNSHGPL